jgi:hypothetical protein
VGINTLMDRRDFGVLEGDGYVEVVLPQLALLPGCYLTSVGILDGIGGTTLDLHNRAYAFSVMSDRRDLGVVHLDHFWTHHAGAEAAQVSVDDLPINQRDYQRQ